ncbi:3-deoxy-8-phosphooctulonate synthase [candidate division FCPU426 bacterium]|nr:3-deoxy-8-phosphooctulonate synthase [candidate division FCPU426 bacterium]
MAETIRLGSETVGKDRFIFIAGPCVIENEEQTLAIARTLADLSRERGVLLVFKASYDKANRSSLDSYRGPGLQEGMRILQRVRAEVKIPILSDVHSPEEAEAAAEYLDCLQIPAFLSRQTELLTSAAKTGKAVNIKKGQFMAPQDMGRALEKMAAYNENILVTERGYSFGYNNLVVDMRSLAILRRFGYPVIFDATHSVQLPGGGEQSGGEREFVPVLARAAAGAGIDGMFMETHPEPSVALSDSATMMKLDEVAKLLDVILTIHRAVKAQAA